LEPADLGRERDGVQRAEHGAFELPVCLLDARFGVRGDLEVVSGGDLEVVSGGLHVGGVRYLGLGLLLANG
jgi:hypothetical protein